MIADVSLSALAEARLSNAVTLCSDQLSFEFLASRATRRPDGAARFSTSKQTEKLL